MAIFIFLGIISSIFQLTLLREFTFSIAKNELSFIIGVGFWLVFCSLGSIVGEKKHIVHYSRLPWALTGVFCFSISGIHLAKYVIGLSYYEAASAGFVFLSAFLLIGAVSFIMGYAFCLFTKMYVERHPYTQKTFGWFFTFEAIGFFIGGVVYAFVLSQYSNPFIFALLPVFFHITYKIKRRKKITSALAITFLWFIFLFHFEPILKREFGNAEILMRSGSRYGPVILAKKFGVESLYVNGSLAATSEDKLFYEEFIHTSLSTLPKAESVLFIGPYFPGHVDEIVKHNVARLDLLNINPVVSQMSQLTITGNTPAEMHFIVDDPRSAIKNTNKKYDCILMNIPAPSNLALNRYFTLEFFQLIKERLTKEGIFCFTIPSKRDILSPRILKFNSCIINTLNTVFSSSFLVPSDSMLVITSKKGVIHPDEVIENFSRANIKTEYFTLYHLRDFLDAARRVYVESMIDQKVNINRDLFPRGFLYYLLLEQAKFYPDVTIDIAKMGYIIPFVFFAFLVSAGAVSLIQKKSTLLLNASAVGFCSFGVTAIIFVLFQTYSGALFWKMGVIVGIFMIGLSIGAFLMNLIVEKISFSRRVAFSFYFLWGLFIFSIFMGSKQLIDWFCADVIFYIYSWFSGILTGPMYPLMTKCMIETRVAPQDISPSIYAADLAGAFASNLCFSIFFIPFLGIESSLLMLLFLMLFFSLIQCMRKK